MEIIKTDPETSKIIEAILCSPTGEIDSHALPLEGYVNIGNNALKGYNHEHTRTST